MNEDEKTYTLKGTKSELKKLREAKARDEAKVQELSEALNAVSTKIKELEKIYN